MKFSFTFCLLSVCLIIAVAVARADYTPPPQRLARALDPISVARLIDSAPASAVVSAPAALLQHCSTNAVDAAFVAALRAAVADTRTNIAEVASLSDLEIASLYLSQLKRDAATLAALAPTNTIEYLIGAGIRLDLRTNYSTQSNSTSNVSADPFQKF